MLPVSVPQIKDAYKEGADISAFFDVAEKCHKWLIKHWKIDLKIDGYQLCNVNQKDIRPIFTARFITKNFSNERDLFIKICKKTNPPAKSREVFSNCIYTIQQTIGSYLDVNAEPQTARKVAGEFFQGLIVNLFKEFRYETSGGNVSFEIDGSGEKVRLSFDILARGTGDTSSGLEPPCVVCGVKTTTKDRMNMFFVDRFLYEETHKHRPTFIAVCLNDVQRKRAKGKTTGISYTFLPGHYKIYEHVFGALDGFYYVVPPPHVSKAIKSGGSLKDIDTLFFDDLPIWLAAK